MLNYLWGFMILAGMFWGAANDSLEAVTQGLLDSAAEAVNLAIVMAGIMSFWCGILEIGKRAGLIDWLAERLGPVLTFLFPELKRDHPARLPIAVNMVANMLGLGMAATPAGGGKRETRRYDFDAGERAAPKQRADDGAKNDIAFMMKKSFSLG